MTTIKTITITLMCDLCGDTFTRKTKSPTMNLRLTVVEDDVWRASYDADTCTHCTARVEKLLNECAHSGRWRSQLPHAGEKST